MRRSPVDPTKATRRPSGVGGHTIRVGANRGRYPTATGRLESSTPATERAFLDQLSESSSPEVVKFAESVFEQAPAHDLTITWGEAGLLLRYEDETGHRFTFGKLSRRGTLGDTHWLCGQCLRRGLDASIYQRYLDQVAALIPGETRRRFRTPKGTELEHVAISDGPKKGGPPLATLVTHGPEWFEIIDATVRKIREALENRDDSAE